MCNRELLERFALLRTVIVCMSVENTDDTGSRSDSTSKRSEREDYWCQEVCTYYPYRLNDNVRGVGNTSKMKGNVVVNTLFNKPTRKLECVSVTENATALPT